MRRPFPAICVLFQAVAAVTLAALSAPAPAVAQYFEPHLANIRQLTFGGENAEAYWSFDGARLIFQSRETREGCDQIYVMGADGTGRRLVSTGKGKCTCSYFLKDGRHILFSSTHASTPDCPPPPDYSKGYRWPVHSSFKVYRARTDGTDLTCLTPWKGYNAEATVSPDGNTIVFTSDKDGDLDLYLMDTEGKNVRRLTDMPGYDGGAFFSPDSTKICFRGFHPSDPSSLKEYRDLLAQELVRPMVMEVYVINADGTGLTQVTRNGAANFCPFFTPDGKRLIFSSNLSDPGHMAFQLYLIDLDGTGLEQVTFTPPFNAFPMFSPDGKRLAWASNRNAKTRGETNLFVADWIESTPPDPLNDDPAIDLNNLRRTIGYLASDELKGRLTGTSEGRKAAEYVAARFEKSGLARVPGLDSYFQPFEFIADVSLAPGNALQIASGDRKAAYEVGKEYTPTGYSDDGDLKDLPVVFAGYGITAPDQKWDDYSGLDVRGKAVFVYRWGPEGDDPKSAFAQYYPVRYKAMVARQRGAAALFVIGASDGDDELMELRASAVSGSAGLPVLSAKRALLSSWLKLRGKSLPDPGNPHAGPFAFEVPGLRLVLSCFLNRNKASADNVAGWLPATEATEETLVIGAHYDHLGLGIEGSLAEKRGGIHHGADDNASGVAGLLETARLAAAFSRRGRNLLFVSFGGEELGTLGSSHLVKNPPIPLKNMVAMVNFDEIGRLRDDKLAVIGAGTSPAFKPLLQESNTEDLKLALTEDGYGASDQSVFYAREIPVLFFFTGAQPQYHRPEDTADLIAYRGEATVLRFATRVIRGIPDAPQRPGYAKVEGGRREQAGRGFRVYLGTIPDYTAEVKGLQLMGVRAGSPAEVAGLKAGDGIVELGARASRTSTTTPSPSRSTGPETRWP
jgi:Tol biopolymer transport system component